MLLIRPPGLAFCGKDLDCDGLGPNLLGLVAEDLAEAAFADLLRLHIFAEVKADDVVFTLRTGLEVQRDII